jgi:hypothetical protein
MLCKRKVESWEFLTSLWGCGNRARRLQDGPHSYGLRALHSYIWGEQKTTDHPATNSC